MHIREEYISFGDEFCNIYGYVLDNILYINSDYKGSDKLIILPS